MAWIIIGNLRDSSGQYTFNTSVLASVAFFLAFVVGSGLIVGVFVYSLIKTVQMKRWGWFAGILLGTPVGFVYLSGIALMAFGLWGPTERRVRTASS